MGLELLFIIWILLLATVSAISAIVAYATRVDYVTAADRINGDECIVRAVRSNHTAPAAIVARQAIHRVEMERAAFGGFCLETLSRDHELLTW